MSRRLTTTFKFKAIEVERPAALVARQIANAVRHGDIRLGERLPSEKTLAPQLSVSRAVLREAIQLLAKAGIVEVIPGAAGGTFIVAQPKERASFDLPVPQLRLGEMVDAFLVRRIIEPGIIELAASRATESNLEAMELALQPIRARLPVAWETTDETLVTLLSNAGDCFNVALARATHNVVIAQVMATLSRWLEPIRLIAIRQSPEAAYSTLEQTLAAIRTGDVVGLRNIIDHRIAYLEDAWQRESGRRLWRPDPSFLREKQMPVGAALTADLQSRK